MQTKRDIYGLYIRLWQLFLARDCLCPCDSVIVVPMPSKKPALRICGVRELPEHLNWATHVVSIYQPIGRYELPLFPHPRANVLELDFDDTTIENPPDQGYLSALVPPRREHIQALINFVRKMPTNAHLLVHCEMGISRSTAIAFVALVAMQPRVKPSTHLEYIYRIRKGAWPNELVVKLGDGLLKENGSLVKVLNSSRKRSIIVR